MKHVLCVAVLALAGCDVAPAGPIPVQQAADEMNSLRPFGEYIFIRGAMETGAQRRTILISSRDQVICSVPIDPVLNADGSTTYDLAYSARVSNSFDGLMATLLPDIDPAPPTDGTVNFVVELGNDGFISTILMGSFDPRFDAFMAYFNNTPNPCWDFN